jgi:hypothetical protein
MSSHIACQQITGSVFHRKNIFPRNFFIFSGFKENPEQNDDFLFSAALGGTARQISS